MATSKECLLDRVEELLENCNVDELHAIYDKLKYNLGSMKALNENDISELITKKKLFRSTKVECYFPDAARSKNLIALSSLTTGDCLYSSVSLNLFGNNSVCDELRIMTCIELYLNASFYGMHPIIMSAFKKHDKIFCNYMSVFSCCVSDSTFNFFSSNDVQFSELSVEFCKKEAIISCKKHIWSSYVSILALSSVIERCIVTYYPDKPSSKYCLILNNQIIYPRVHQSKSTISPINILFCCSSPNIRSKNTSFTPNHYVPLVSSKLICKSANKKSVVMKKNVFSKHIYNFFKKSESKIKDNTIFAIEDTANCSTTSSTFENAPSYSQENCSVQESLSDIKSVLSSCGSFNELSDSFATESCSSMSVSVSSPVYKKGLYEVDSNKVLVSETNSSKCPSNFNTSKMFSSCDSFISTTSNTTTTTSTVVSSSNLDVLSKELSPFSKKSFSITAQPEVSNDVAKFSSIVKTMSSREDIMRLYKNVYKPDESFKFPKTKICNVERSFSFKFLSMYPWLAYSCLLYTSPSPRDS